MSRVRRSSPKAGAGRSQKWLFAGLVVLMAAALVLVASFLNRETRTRLAEPVYQYFLDQRTEYAAGTELITGENTVLFDGENGRSASSTTPIYYEQRQALLLPTRMNWLDVTTGREWQLPQLSRIELDSAGSVWYADEKTQIRLEGGILSGGNGTYLFLDAGTLEVDGRRVELPPLSYCAQEDDTLRVYPYGGEAPERWKSVSNNLILRSSQEYQVDLTAGIYTARDGTQRLITASPQALPVIQERQA